MPLAPRVKFAIAAGATTLAAGGIIWWATTRPDKNPHGRLLCPGQVGRQPLPPGSATKGDFAVVQLQSGDGKFTESTWASIVGRSGNSFVAVLTGEQIPAGIKHLHTDKHGYRLGHRMILDPACIWEVFRPKDHEGHVLCGPQITDLASFLGDDTLYPIEAGQDVNKGDRAQIVIGSDESFGNAWFEKLWTKITKVSKSGQVITAKVQKAPERAEHGLKRGSVLKYNRDCIIGV